MSNKTRATATSAPKITKNPFGGKTPKGIMPPCKVALHRLSGGEPFVPSCHTTTRRGTRPSRLFTALVKKYRQMVHGSQGGRLPASLRNAVHYMLEPMTKGFGPTTGHSVAPKNETDDSLTAVQSPLKV